MIKHKTSGDFWKYFYSLDEDKQIAARKAFEQLKVNIRHSSLQFKKLSSGYFSVRTKLDYRVVGFKIKDGLDVIYAWIWIGSKEDFKSFIRSLPPPPTS